MFILKMHECLVTMGMGYYTLIMQNETNKIIVLEHLYSTSHSIKPYRNAFHCNCK